MLLIEQYSIVCQYNRSKKDTDCILSYFDFKLGEIGINPKPCPITDDEGETVAYDYPSYSVKPKSIDFTGFDDIYLPQNKSRE